MRMPFARNSSKETWKKRTVFSFFIQNNLLWLVFILTIILFFTAGSFPDDGQQPPSRQSPSQAGPRFAVT